MTVELEVKVEACSKYSLVHTWTVHQNICTDYLGEKVALPDTIVTNTPLLILPPNTLQYGLHCIKFHTVYSRTVIDSEVRIPLLVQRSDLRPIIEGGSERSVATNEKNVLDGSQSYDPDDNVHNLSYSWTCTATASAAVLNADNTLGALAPAPGADGCFSQQNTSQVIIPRGTLVLGYIYSISLTVFAPDRASATVKQKVYS